MGRIYRLEREQRVEQPLEIVFDFFSNAENLGALTPPFLHFRILSKLPIEMRVGAKIDYALKLAGIPIRWRTNISVWEPNVRFVDEQEKGPYSLWRHTHEFEADGSATIVRDLVDYSLPLGPLGWLAHKLVVRRTLDRIFDYRAERMSELVGAAAAA